MLARQDTEIVNWMCCWSGHAPGSLKHGIAHCTGSVAFNVAIHMGFEASLIHKQQAVFTGLGNGSWASNLRWLMLVKFVTKLEEPWQRRCTGYHSANAVYVVLSRGVGGSGGVLLSTICMILCVDSDIYVSYCHAFGYVLLYVLL